MLWSLKAIVWWTLLSKALHCILCFNDHFPKQPIVNRNSCMHKYVKLTFLASIDCMVGPCKCLNQLTRNIYWRTELFLSWDLHVQLSHSIFLLQLAETEIIRHCRLGGYVFPYQYNSSCFLEEAVRSGVGWGREIFLTWHFVAKLLVSWIASLIRWKKTYNIEIKQCMPSEEQNWWESSSQSLHLLLKKSCFLYLRCENFSPHYKKIVNDK